MKNPLNIFKNRSKFMARLHASVESRRDRFTILIVPVLYALFMLAMQYSKHKHYITPNANLRDYLPVLHAELSIFLVISALLFLFISSRWTAFTILTTYYIISLFDYIAWTILHRPFFPTDLANLLEVISHYPQFALTNLNLAIKLFIYTLFPVIVGLVLQIILRLEKRDKPWIDLMKSMIFRCASVIFIVYFLLMPFTASSKYMHHNSLIKIGKEIAFNYKLNHLTLNAAGIQKFLGPLNQHRIHKGIPNYKNIILIILETSPYQYYSNMSRCAKVINKKLKGNYIILDEHYTTYPESDRSFLSILAGKYPPLVYGSGWVSAFDYSRSLPSVLKSHGYKSYVASTAPLDFHDNLRMMKNLGFDHVIEIEETKKAVYYKNKNGPVMFDRPKLYAADLSLLDQTLDIISSHVSDHYLLTILPQASHAPFQRPPGYSGDGSEKSLIEANALWQFDVISRIIKKIEETNQNDRTIFIITGDHGIRFPYESKLFPNIDILSPLTFQVPFMLYSGSNVFPPVPIKATSHIDITPTILDLLNISYNDGDYHGRSIFLDVPRMIFFFGGEDQPSSGFKEGARFYMENRYQDLILANSTFNFDKKTERADSTIMECNIQERIKVSNTLKLMKGFILQTMKSK